MKKFLIFILVASLTSTALYEKSGKKSSFGKWNYDKFGKAQKKLSSGEVRAVGGSNDPCRQYVHIDTKFHVRMKNWTRWISIGLSGYAEMRVTLGTASKSCGIPYNIPRMDIWYDRNRHSVVRNKSYIRVTMKGVGAVNECYKAVGYAFSKDGIILPNGYRGNITIKPNTSKLPGNIDLEQLFGINVEQYNIPFVHNEVSAAWFVPVTFTTGGYTVKTIKNAGAIMNNIAGCQKVKIFRYTHEF